MRSQIQSLFPLPAAALLVPSLLLGALPGQAGDSTYGKARTKRQAELGRLPSPADVVVRDLINYHRHMIPLPRAGEELAVDMRWDTPLAAHRGESVLQIGLATPRLVDTKDLRPLNVALVIDRSSSMAASDKMGRLKQALKVFIRQLRPADRLSIVAYSSEAEVCLPAQPVGDRRRALEVVRRLEPGGYTNLHGGLMLGYREVVKGCEEDANHRVILLTDGLANRGKTDPAGIAKDSKTFNARGIDLSTIGFGANVNQDLLGKLAKKGRGLFHFVADDEDIRKVFLTEAQSLMGVIGRKVRIEILPDAGLEVTKIYGYQLKREGGRLVVTHNDFNYGMTTLLVAKVRRVPVLEDDALVEGSASARGRVRVRVTYESAKSGQRVAVARQSQFLDPRSGRGATDHVVRKNFTIAVMAEAMHQMARRVKDANHAEADRVLGAASRFFARNYPNTTDPDLRQTHGILKKYRSILAQHIERFRDL